MSFKASLIAFSLVLVAAVPAFGHGGSAPMPGEWHEEIVRFRVNDNWSQEVCFRLDEKTEASVRYEFTAQVPVKFDFHFHPSEGEYATTHFLRLKGADSHQGVADIGDVGIYCFDFFPGTRVKQERTATLRYRVD